MYKRQTYGGDQSVTTAQAALMLMKALGYFQFQSDFENDWQFSTIKQANKIDLFIDVESGVIEPMTRNDLAQLVLNTLKAGTVEADNDTIKVDAEGVKMCIRDRYITVPLVSPIIGTVLIVVAVADRLHGPLPVHLVDPLGKMNMQILVWVIVVHI